MCTNFSTATVFQININESRPLRFVKVPSLRSGNEILKYEKKDLDSQATVNRVDETTAHILFKSTPERQKELAHNLGTEENQGLAGQFVVQYDVVREPNGGEVCIDFDYLQVTHIQFAYCRYYYKMDILSIFLHRLICKF